MEYSPPGSPVHGIFQTRILESVATGLLQEIFLTQVLNPCLQHLLHWQVGSLLLEPPVKPLTGWETKGKIWSMLEAWVGEGGTGKTGAGPGWDWTSERDEIYTVTVMDRAEGKAGFQKAGQKAGWHRTWFWA